MGTILITGGTGMIGTRLTKLLQKEGHTVTHLSRSKLHDDIKTYHWDIEKKIIDEEALTSADHIAHLAGSNVGNKRWTKAYKKEIFSSRVDSANLLFETLRRVPNQVKTFISASAMGYYGDRGDEWLKEDAAPADDFFGRTCVKWEAAAQQFSTLGKRTVMIRAGLVLAKEGGALPALARPVRFGVAPIFGNGRQWYSWIHIDDLCRIYLHAIKNEQMQGPYIGMSPSPERFVDLMNEIAQSLKRKKINIPVPMSLLKIAMGEFVETLAYSTRCSSEKIEGTGFEFKFRGIEEALAEIYG